MLHIVFHQENGNLKTYDATTHLLDWLKSGTMATPNIVKYKYNDIVTLEDNLAIYYETKNYFTIWYINHNPWYSLKGVENMSILTLAHNIYNSFISNCQNLEAIKISFSRWMDE